MPRPNRRTRSAPMIQLCGRCGQMRIHHGPGKLYVCAVPDEVIEALREYRRERGKCWRHHLTRQWAGHTNGAQVWPLLWQARNLIGPRRLYLIDLDDPDRRGPRDK